jgi:hypothetical protein
MNYLMTYEGMSEYDVSDIDRIFRRTAPRNILQALVEARNAGIVLSNQTLVELSGLPIDPILEAERIENERALPVTDNTMDRTSPVMEGSDSEGSENGSADTEPRAGSQ